MDRVTPVIMGTAGYAMMSLAASLMVASPKHLTATEQKNYCGFHISLIHSVIACALASYVLWAEGGLRYDGGFTQTHIWVLGLTLGYFIYDIMYAEWFRLHDNLMRFHHVFVLIGGGMLYFSESGGCLTLYVILLTESSNPAMQTRLILKARKEEDTQLYRVTQLVFAFQFIFNRGVIATPLTYNTWFYDLDWTIKVSASMLYGASVIWILIIIGIISKKLPVASVPERLLRWLRETHKKFPFVVNGLVLVNALLTPSLLKGLGAGPLHFSILGTLVF